MKPTRKIIIWLLISILLLAGCRSGNAPAVVTSAVQGQPENTAEAASTSAPEPVASAEPGSSEATPYPSPTKYSSPTPQSYPQPPQTQPVYTPPPFVVPTPAEGTGVVWGQMIDLNTNEPMQYVYIYLGKKIPLTPGPGYTYGLQEQSSPHIQTNDKGQFAISGIEPGNYIIMIFTPRSASVVMVPDTDKEMEVNVAAGDVQELGELRAVPPTF